MASSHRLNVTEWIRNGQTAFANTAIEVVLMPFVRFPFIKCTDVLITVNVFIPVFLNWSSDDLTTVNKNSTFGSFKGNAIVSMTRHVHGDTIGELVDDREFMRRIVAIVYKRISILVFNRVLTICTVNFNRSLLRTVLIKGPHCDIYVMSSPVGELTT